MLPPVITPGAASANDIVHLRAGELEAEIMPGLGMTVVSLRRGSGPQLLYVTNMRIPRPVLLGPPGPESAATLAPLLLGGWFEMNPTAGLPSNSSGAAAYFHGEAIRKPWTVIDHGPDFLKARSTACGDALALARRISVEAGRLVVATQIRNVGTNSVTISPGEHPCFPRELFAGGRLENETLEIASNPSSLIPPSADSSSGNATLRLRGPVTLRARDGRSLIVEPDGQAHQTVGVWWNYVDDPNPTSPERWDCLAVEPLTHERALEPGETFNSKTALVVGAEWGRSI